ncbi:hypothetical protein [Bacillus badius]|uniref:Phage protein n=1 Tax=Bacillus badius TaxID=1455 RepID=A0ABR5AXW9_BACBA|nr:hypothetical protein [Bacillus badius]KIL79585.1 hypothetical protein SD77_2039 [Bacillus badius]MED4716280.1 hypothetical protein [Bacillus badius]
MNLQPQRDTIISQKEFLRNTVGMEFKTAGLTLDASKFTAGQYVKAGTAVFKNETSGLFEPVQADTPETMLAACLTSHDVKVTAGVNPVVGGVMGGHPIESKCTGVTANFKAATKGRLTFDI